ncbi:hypothetical protein WME99_07615 [Sorangium sp. So ce136]|uniref:hypothetical protein n=1 Tax=Sorangium sp. So ce136 TaxID=3133284 RepID=UPI003F09403B
MAIHPRLITCLSLAGAGGFVLVGGCGTGTGAEQVGAADEHLTAAQCAYFDVDGKDTICHKTGSTTHPYTIIKTNEQGCINGHAGHAHDYIAVGDPTCQGGGCLPAGAPCDATLPCCSGATCTDGTCTVTCTPTTCEAQGAACGTIPDGCGDTLACSACADGGGTCASDDTCGCPLPPGLSPECASNVWDAAAQACELTFAGVDTACFGGGTCNGNGFCGTPSTTPLY